ncbi:unnamed protein product [Closterium sp. NIES-54]
MAGPGKRGGRGAGGSGEVQTQGQPRDSAMAPVQPSLGPPRDEPRVFGLDKFDGDNFAEWSFKMENIFDHYDLLEVMEGTEKRSENDPEKSPWVRKSAQGYLLLGQALGSSQIRHIKPFQREPEDGPKPWADLKGICAPTTAAVAVVLERQMAALRIEEDEAVEEEQASAEGMAVEGAEDEGEADLAATSSTEAAGVADTAATTRATDAVAADSTASATIVTRADICDAIATSSLMDGLLIMAKRVKEQEEGEEEAVEAVAVAERAEVKGMGKAMFKGADGKMVGLKNQLVKNEMVAGIRVKGKPDQVLGCPTCMQAKFTHYPFSSLKATDKAPLDEVVMDVVGPLKLGTAGAEYFLTIVDVYTRMTWVYVLSKKSDVAETVKTDWLPMVERQQDRLVKAIRTDRGGEFLSKEFSLWLKKNGIRHSLTMPYSLAMNGIAARANRTITETAHGLLIEAGLPEYFWPDASDYEECAFTFFSPVEMPGEPATLKESLESSDAEEWKKAMESELKSIEENGTWELVAAGMRVAKYLGQTPTVGLQYLAAAQRRQKGADGVEPGRLFLTVFLDAFHASELEDMTRVGGFICCDGGGPTAWESKKQVDQALSSVESEYMALFRAVREIVWQRRFLAELGEEQQGPTPQYCDSQGAIALTKNPVLHGFTKHMRVKWHWTRSIVAAGDVELRYIKTTGQPADMMTKRLVEQKHWRCYKLAGMALN